MTWGVEPYKDIRTNINMIFVAIKKVSNLLFDVFVDGLELVDDRVSIFRLS